MPQVSPPSDPQDPHMDLYDVDNPSTIITLTDWYQQYTQQLAGKDHISPLTVGAEPFSVFNSGLDRQHNCGASS